MQHIANFAFGDGGCGNIHDHGSFSFARYSDRDRIGGEPALDPTIGRYQLAATMRINEHHRSHALIGSHGGVVANASKMTAVSSRDCRHTHALGLLNGNVHSFSAHNLAEAPTAIDERERIR